MPHSSSPDDTPPSAAAALEQLDAGTLTPADIGRRQALPVDLRRLQELVGLLAQHRMEDFDVALRSALDAGVAPSELFETLSIAAQHGVDVPPRAIEQLRTHVNQGDLDGAT